MDDLVKNWLDSMGQQIATVIVFVSMLAASVRGYLGKGSGDAKPATPVVSHGLDGIDDLRRSLRDLERSQDRTADAVIRGNDILLDIKDTLEKIK